jgi:hypothetical protein
MKKIIYSAMLLLVLAASAMSCTEENVKPQASNPGGVGTDPLK